MATDKDEKPRDDDYPDIVPEDTRGDLALEAGALVANFLPGLGGAIANVLSGWSAERKRERVREVIASESGSHRPGSRHPRLSYPCRTLRIETIDAVGVSSLERWI